MKKNPPKNEPTTENCTKQQYNVTGMSCSACSARVEKVVSLLPGVQECSVNLLTNSMQVKTSLEPEKIIEAVKSAGYGAELAGGATPDRTASVSVKSEDTKQKSVPDETKILARRLVLSSVFLLVLMYFSMAHTMWGAPLPHFFDGNHIAIALVQMILSAIILLINKKFFVSGFKAAIHLSPNMDTLVSLGSGISFLYSVVVLFRMTTEKESLSGHGGLYFESAAMIVTLITVGKLLESISKGRTTDALKNLMALAPKTAILLRDGKETEVPIEEVKVGDIFIVRPGQNVSVDGIVLEGSSSVNESNLTGESLPVDKTVGSEVSSGTTNVSGFLKCRAVRVGKDTTIEKIIQLISDSSATKAPIARLADKVSLVFVPAIMAISVVTLVVWLCLGSEFSFALSRAIAVLVVSCPCALGLATPVAIMVGNGVGARNGILFKTAASLEQAGKIKNIVLDKTGTITKGELEVTKITVFDSASDKNDKIDKIDKDELLSIAASLEAKSEHPIAKAICDAAEAASSARKEATDFISHAGNGIEAKIDGKKYFVGKKDFVYDFCLTTNYPKHEAADSATTVYVADKENILGVIELSDTIKDESPAAIADLKKMGLKVVMLTGDNEKAANAIAKKVGVDEFVANLLPDQKLEQVARLMQSGKTAMVGDGVNDAPALTKADIGIAIGAGSGVALDSADIVLVKSKLDDVAVAIRLSRRTLLNIKENLFWAFFYNVALIPVAAGCYSAFGVQLTPMLGALAMSLSSFCVVMNALRLNLARIKCKSHKSRH